MSARLMGFGTASPDHSIDQADAAELHATFCQIDGKRARTLRAIYRRSGVARRQCAVLDASSGPIEDRQSFFPPSSGEGDQGPPTSRRMELYEAVAPGLAAEASQRALAASGLETDRVTHVVTVSCTGFLAPGLDAHVIETLHLPERTSRVHVGFMGCHGALNGLRVADSIVRADSAAVALVCAVELCSLHFAYGWDPDMLVPNALFSDGAGATVVCADRGEEQGSGWRLAATGTHRFPDSADTMTWRIADHGFRMTLSARVPDLIEGQVGAWLDRWLAESGLRIGDVGSWAIHPGGPRLLISVERAVQLDRAQTEASRTVLSRHGNMSSATILFILDRLWREAAPLPCVALAFGPGLVVEAALIV